jgi:DNA-directed RNA polymerase specialized sigma24 family protein
MAFPATHRSVIDRIRDADAGVRRHAFGDLAAGYWKPSYHYLRLHWRLSPEEAEDAVQAFFTTAFEKRYVERYDPAKARFRTFLRTCLDRFIMNARKADRADKRGGDAERLSLDFPGAERELAAHATAPAPDAEDLFQRETVRALFARTVADLANRYRTEGREIVFRVFERYDLADDDRVTYDMVARELDLPVTQVTNFLFQARRRFRELVLADLRGLVGSGEEFRAEARDLFGFEVRE